MTSNTPSFVDFSNVGSIIYCSFSSISTTHRPITESVLLYEDKTLSFQQTNCKNNQEIQKRKKKYKQEIRKIGLRIIMRGRNQILDYHLLMTFTLFI